jgi:hypothetical protein
LWIALALPVAKDPAMGRLEAPFQVAGQVARTFWADIHGYGLGEADLAWPS